MTAVIRNEWKQMIIRMPSLFLGFLLFAIGMVASLYAGLGMSPWGVFHMGITNYTPLTLGQVSQLTGVMILGIACYMGEIPGIGSIFNMIFIGFFIDIIEVLGIFSVPNTLTGKLALLLLSIVSLGWASFFYLRVHWGAGPRDGLMEALVKKLQKPVWLIRGAMECTVLLVGYFLGGPVGMGTVISALTIGFSVQLAFKLGKYNAEEARHINCIEMFDKLTGRKLTEKMNH